MRRTATRKPTVVAASWLPRSMKHPFELVARRTAVRNRNGSGGGKKQHRLTGRLPSPRNGELAATLANAVAVSYVPLTSRRNGDFWLPHVQRVLASPVLRAACVTRDGCCGRAVGKQASRATELDALPWLGACKPW